ncbi:hypothetical protein RBU61_08475 [Tissierella sp. MB52-C2]|uniref:hypothetical protein n=1 Tax=Tissierella sp. MB52-C2 TaxID=3070999 RepID=UPI00280B9A0F|nr:hypothetical protein [Tissierella sp. MB52-C2]WMM26700.1 hypothetical protein RBU61_08475 [Tissierella sp. MB52-C2]
MSRLPTPILDGLAATYDENYQAIEKNFYKVLGGIIRAEEFKEKINKKKEGSEEN